MGCVVSTVLFQKRCQNFCVPAAARQYLNNCHVGFDAEELQRLNRVSVLIALDIRRVAMICGNQFLQPLCVIGLNG